jgi:hypothetical protein
MVNWWREEGGSEDQ